MKLSDFAVKRPVAILMLVSIVVLLGIVSWSLLSVDLYPDIKLPIAGVITSYAGAGPEEIESQITRPVEEIIGTIANVKNIRSMTRAGSSIVVVEFNWGTDMDFATLQVREKVDMVKKFFPAEVDTPLVVKMDPSMLPIVQIGMSGPKDLVELKTIAEEDIKSSIERIPGVASVVITGGLTREVQVQVDPIRMQNYGLSLGQVTQVLRSDNFNQSSGQIHDAHKVLFVRNLGQFESIEELENLPLLTTANGTVYLRDIAVVIDGFTEPTQYTRMDGRSSIGIHVLKQSDANTVAVVEELKAEMEQIRSRLPQDIEIEFIFDQAKFINLSISSVQRTALQGALLAVLVIFLFLRNMRSTLIISVAIPLSIISTFILMYFAGITFNLISMGGLALGIGRMVDDSIVVLECIYRYRKNGYTLYESARLGAAEVGNAVMASTFTTIAVFLPIVFVEGISALIFKQLALTVSFAIFSSLIVALTLVPMLSSKMLTVDDPKDPRAQKGYRRILQKWGNMIDALNVIYLRLLRWALGHRKTVVIGVTVILIASLGLIPLIGAEFLPSMDSGEISINIQMDKGSTLEWTDQLTQKLEAVLQEVPEVDTVFTSVGPSGNMMMETGAAQTDVALLRVMLVSRTERIRDVEQVADDIRDQLLGIPGAQIKVSASDPMMAGMSSSSPISISLKGDNLQVLKELAERTAAEVRQVPGTREVDTTISTGNPEIQIRVDRQKAAAYGLSGLQVASTVKTAIDGQVATRYHAAEQEIDVRVRLQPEARENLQQLENLILVSATGAQVPLNQVARIEYGIGPSVIDRENQVRVVSVTGDIFGRDLKSVMTDIKTRLDQMPLPPGYTLEYGGVDKEMQEAFIDLTKALLLAIVLVYMVMAIQYESFVYPFVIMFTMPTTVIGVILSLAITGRSLSVVAFVGLIMLAGIVVSNGIVLVDYINTLRRRGMEREQAILTAGPVRLRPILMTAIATILAMFPLALGLGEGGEGQAPMATVVIGGLTMSTILTLVLLPVVYTLFDDLGNRVKARLRRRLMGVGSGSLPQER
ncbi:MAG: efflux RND transporter permease subunit [Syntrophomonadaceae bacterium]|nr:efflux RND transporter permease subunit [Syntrophomonadaceae bacterium]